MAHTQHKGSKRIADDKEHFRTSFSAKEAISKTRLRRNEQTN